MTLSDKSRRIQVLILFVIFGPVLFLTVLGLVWHSRSRGGVHHEESTLQAYFNLPLTLTDVEFVRPGTTAYFGLKISSPQNGASFLFIPEILSLRPEEPISKETILGLFTTSARDASLESVEGLGTKEGREGADDPGNDGQGTTYDRSGSTPFSSFPFVSPENDREWLIPDLYLKIGQGTHPLQILERGGITREGKARRGTIRFRVGRIHLLQNRAAFDKIIADYQRPKERFRPEEEPFFHKKEREIVPLQLGTDDLQNQVKETAARLDTFLLKDGEGLFSRSDRSALLLFTAEPNGIPAPSKGRLAIQRDWSAFTEPVSPASPFHDASSDQAPVVESSLSTDPDERVVWLLDTRQTPIPSVMAAPFLPLFDACGSGSWFTGLFLSEEGKREDRDPSQGGPLRYERVALHDVTLFNGDLATLLQKVTTTRLTGRVLRLLIDDGGVRDGIFFGHGRIYLAKGGLDKGFLVRFQKEFHLDFSPKNTLTNRFPENRVPYDQIAFSFDFLPEGIRLQSLATDASGLVGKYSSETFPFQIFLPTEPEPPVPYARVLSTLADGEESRFWSSFYRDALNHLPTGNE